jgi:hypothetical protein
VLETVELHNKKFIVFGDLILETNVQMECNWYNEETLLEIEIHPASILLRVF